MVLFLLFFLCVFPEQTSLSTEEQGVADRYGHDSIDRVVKVIGGKHWEIRGRQDKRKSTAASFWRRNSSEDEKDRANSSHHVIIKRALCYFVVFFVHPDNVPFGIT